MNSDPQGKTVHGLAEIVLWTSDMDRALAFYGDLFGLELISEPDFKNKFLSAGEGPWRVPGMIVLMPRAADADPFPPDKPHRVLHHLAFAVNPHRYDDLMERCSKAGLNVRHGIHPVLKGVRTFYVDDPEGNEVEIIARDPERKRQFAEG